MKNAPPPPPPPPTNKKKVNNCYLLENLERLSKLDSCSIGGRTTWTSIFRRFNWFGIRKWYAKKFNNKNTYMDDCSTDSFVPSSRREMATQTLESEAKECFTLNISHNMSVLPCKYYCQMETLV